jgi:uncharacterized membrane protein
MNAKKGLKAVGKEVKKDVQNTIVMPAKKVGEIGEDIVKTISKPFISDKRKLTLGQRTADSLSKWAGSWVFIIGFFVFLSLWMATNIYAWLNTWDPYPFILLNLVLSCLAAIQAPVILMSQNRANQRDRMRAEYDYEVNRKAEKEIQEMILQLNRIEDKLEKKKK